MKKECDIIQDLLPTYLDHTCSEASKEYVEEHLAACTECSELVQECHNDTENEKFLTELPAPGSVLKKTSWKLHIKAILNCIGITGIILYWLLYLWAKFFSDQGNYRYFSWKFWEIFSTGTMIVPVLTGVWVVILAVQSIRKKTWKKNVLVGLIVLVLLGTQLGYLHSRSNIVHVTNWATVERIPDEYHIVISSSKNGDHSTITLETTPMITRLLKVDGTVYGFQYEHKEDNPNEGNLIGMWDSND